jgi:hypothetical protein
MSAQPFTTPSVVYLGGAHPEPHPSPGSPAVAPAAPVSRPLAPSR